MIAVKGPCKVASAANIALSGTAAVNGVAVTAGNRVLVRAQTNPVDNGIYVVASGAWSRANDCNGAGDVTQGTLVYVWDGTPGWYYLTTENPVPGSTALDWSFETWQANVEYIGGASAGSGAATAEVTATVTAEFSASGSGSAAMEALNGSSGYSAGVSAGDAVGTATVTAVMSAAGSATVVGVVLGANPLWIFSSFDITSDVERYSLDVDSATSHTSLSVAMGQQSAAGDASRAIMHGSDLNTTQAYKYTYSTYATATSATMGWAYDKRFASQTSSTAYFFCGGDSLDARQDDTDKVVFATDVRSAGTVISSNRSTGQAQGNSTKAIIAGGTDGANPLKTTRKYTFAGDVVAAGTSLSTERYSHGAVGSTAVGIFSGGITLGSTTIATSEKYTYSGDTVAAATSLSSAKSFVKGGGINSVGLFSGDSTASTSTERYNLSTDAVSAGGTLAVARKAPAMIAEAPGGL